MPSFVQSLPLVEEETRQAVYDTREHVLQQQQHQQQLDEEQREVAAATTASLQPSAPPRHRNGVRLTRSGDFSAVNWQLVGPGHDPGLGAGSASSTCSVSPSTPPAPGVARCSSAEALPPAFPGPAPATPPQRPSSGHGLFSFFRWFKKGSRHDGTESKKPAAGRRAVSSDFDDYDDDDDDDDDITESIFFCTKLRRGHHNLLLSLFRFHYCCWCIAG